MDRGKKSIFVDLTDNGSGGGGLAISNSHIFATTTARDTYFTTNPAEKKVGVMISVGSGYQEWSGTAWIDKTAVVKGAKGDTGPAGPTGPQGPQGPAGTGTGTGSGLPTGGTTGQVLKKKSATDGDADWEDEATGTGSTSLLDPVADLTALKAIDTTSFTTVKEIQVATLGLYKFQPASTLTGDDVNVITPTTGSAAGRWVKQSIDLTEQTINVISGVTITGTETINQNSLKEKGEILIPKKTRFNKARKVVFFGSSVCGGYAITNYADSYAGKITTALTSETDMTYSFKNISVGGNTTQLILDRFKDVIAENPDIVVIGLSTNNENLYIETYNNLAGATVTAYKKKLEKIVALCEQYGFQYIIAGEYAVDATTPVAWNSKKKLNHELSKIYGDRYINWMGQVTDTAGAFKTALKVNGSHPNEAGHLKMFENINLNSFNSNRKPFKPFIPWGGKCKCTTAGSYVARSYGHDALNNYTFTFEASKGTGGNSITLWGSSHALQVRIDANGFIAIYEGSTLKTTTTVKPVADKKNKIVITRDLTLALIKVFIDDVEVSSFTPTSTATLSQFFIGNDGVTSGTTAIGWEFANLVLYRGVLDIGGIKHVFKNDYPQSVIEFANSMNINGASEFVLYSESSGDAYIQLAATQSWAVSDYTDNTFTATEKEKLANSTAGTFTTNDGKTITITGGMVTSIV